MTLGHERLDVHQVREEPMPIDENPFDPDPDSDLDETNPQQNAGVVGSRSSPLTGILL